MNKITITDKKSDLSAVILPSFGAMVSELKIGEINVLSMNYQMLGLGNVLAGGIPVLFPFAGKTLNDTIVFNEKSYTMPMHGFAKDMPFNIVSQQTNACSLVLSANETITANYFPFDFDLIITYTIDGGSIVTSAEIKNKSQESFPIGIGFHPYFLTTRKAETTFNFNLKHFYDYTNGLESVPVQGIIESDLKLEKKYDHVFYDQAGLNMSIQNPNDGYEADITTDNSFNIATISTGANNASCLEPWQSFPNVLHRNEYWQWVPVNKSLQFSYKIVAKKK
jgi:galactose mutarotase-like enzyme